MGKRKIRSLHIKQWLLKIFDMGVSIIHRFEVTATKIANLRHAYEK